MQGKNARMVSNRVLLVITPMSLHTSLNLLAQVGCQGSIVASTPKCEGMQ